MNGVEKLKISTEAVDYKYRLKFLSERRNNG